MDFGHDPYFYMIMHQASADAARVFPNCEAYSRYLRIRKHVQSNDEDLRLKEYLQCMEHADYLEKYGLRRPKRLKKIA